MYWYARVDIKVPANARTRWTACGGKEHVLGVDAERWNVSKTEDRSSHAVGHVFVALTLITIQAS